MPSYFRQVPDFDYVSRDPNQRQISEYATVKNLFRRGKLRDDIFGNLSYFTKYKIIGDERPDNVAFKLYNDETLDWVILLSNNILNIQTEWPLPQSVFDRVMLEKYGSYDELYSGIHHYETIEIRDSLGNIILPSGIQIPNQWKSGNGFVQSYKTSFSFATLNANGNVTITSTNTIPNLKIGSTISLSNFTSESLNGSFLVKDVTRSTEDRFQVIDFTITPSQSVTNNDLVANQNEVIEFISSEPLIESTNYYYQYYDNNLQTTVRIPSSTVVVPITNYDYEIKLEEDKRNIFILKSDYLNVVFNDLEEIMTYKKGSTQYVSRTLKKGDNIRLFQ
jgi:hypothetical protein